MNENDLAREIGSIVVEFRGGWDWRLWLTARGVCKKRTCLETSCFRVGGQLVFRDELFDFRREEGGFPACSSLPRWWMAWEEGKGGGKSCYDRWRMKVTCIVRCAKETEREKKSIGRKILKISGKKWLAKWCSIERRRKSILTKLSNYFKEEALPSIVPFSSFVPLFLSLFDARSRGFFIDRQRGGEKSREQIRQKGGRKRLDFLREILFANVGDINKWSPDKKIRTVARKDFPARNAFTWHLIFLATSLSSFFPFFYFLFFFFPPTFFPPFTSFALPQRELFSVNKSERLGEVAYSTIEFLKLEIVAIERWKVEMKGVK